MKTYWLGVLFFVGACADSNVSVKHTDIPSDQIVSGSTFLTTETLAQQQDVFENPGYLWVDQAKRLFEFGQKACVTCHEDRLVGAAATYPKIDPSTEKLLNLEARINQCRTAHQSRPALAYDSEDLLSLTAYVANQSHGLPVHVETEGKAAEYIEAGRTYFFTRRGQLNLACNNCHDDNWGKQLRGDTISQGHGNGFPAYRLEWQELGSLHRRLHDCDTGVRAEPHALGGDVYTTVELYLAARANGLAVESPAIRR